MGKKTQELERRVAKLEKLVSDLRKGERKHAPKLGSIRSHLADVERELRKRAHSQ